MEDKIKEIFNKHWKTKLNGSINYETMTSITEKKVLNEIWNEAQKELLEELYNFQEEFNGELEFEILNKLNKLKKEV